MTTTMTSNPTAPTIIIMVVESNGIGCGVVSVFVVVVVSVVDVVVVSPETVTKTVSLPELPLKSQTINV